jgi:hypothetical protein
LPTYVFETPEGKVFEEFMTLSEREQYFLDNPTHKQLVSAPAIIGGVATKPCDGFRDLLKDIKKRNSRGISQAKINTF